MSKNCVGVCCDLLYCDHDNGGHDNGVRDNSVVAFFVTTAMHFSIGRKFMKHRKE